MLSVPCGAAFALRARPQSPTRSSSPCSVRPTRARRIEPSSACWSTRRGMLGLPLRLLGARGLRSPDPRGRRAGASRSSREKRNASGERPRYWVCTVEAMPVEHEVDFLAVDEIQLAAHPHRGHVFTDRLLHCARPLRNLVSRRGYDASAAARAGPDGRASRAMRGCRR